MPELPSHPSKKGSGMGKEKGCRREQGSGLISYAQQIATAPFLGLIPLNSNTVILKRKRVPRLYAEHTQTPERSARKLLFSPRNILSPCANAYVLGKFHYRYFVAKVLKYHRLKESLFHICTRISSRMDKTTPRFQPILSKQGSITFLSFASY